MLRRRGSATGDGGRGLLFPVIGHPSPVKKKYRNLENPHIIGNNIYDVSLFFVIHYEQRGNSIEQPF
jgi:hypothetical protein